MATPRRRRRYAFVRREEPNFANLQAQGWDTPLFAADDPRLAQQVARARAAGSEFGIWADPAWSSGGDPEAFARYMAGINQRYNPSVLVPDIEFVGKGYQGSPGWNYNQQLAQAWAKYLPGVNTAITPMGRQSDFNYEAWQGLVSEWLPQAYGADSNREPLDPAEVIKYMTDRGVDPSLITPVLSPAHAKDVFGSTGNYAIWTMDDFVSRGFPPAAAREMAAQANAQAQAEAPKPRPRASQSREMIQDKGLEWGGEHFNTKEAFAQSLRQHGADYDTWAKRHPAAAAALEGRPVSVAPVRPPAAGPAPLRPAPTGPAALRPEPTGPAPLRPAVDTPAGALINRRVPGAGPRLTSAMINAMRPGAFGPQQVAKPPARKAAPVRPPKPKPKRRGGK